MQILINLIIFLCGFGVGYLYGYYIRSRRAIRTLNTSIERTLKEQEQLRKQYQELRATLAEIKQQRIHPTVADLHHKHLKRLR